jgi:hypothetical protein
MSAAAAPAARSKKPVRRTDPRPKHVDGMGSLARLKNQNPTKRYVLASVSELSGLQRYRAMGWDVEIYTGEPNCLQFAGGQTCKPGDPLETMGMVCVSISAEKHAQIVQYGEDGESGQAEADRIEDRIIDRGSMRDAIRGINGGNNYFDAQNKTSPAREEWIGPGVDDGEADPFGG